MAEFFDFDPLTGVRYDFDYDEEKGNAIIHASQDVQDLLDYNTRLRNDSMTDKGIKESWWLYAKIPPIVFIKMRNQGINAEDPRNIKRVLEEINTNYPMLKVTQKHEGGKVKQIYLGVESASRSKAAD
jgi:hypothetical protein